MFIAALFTIARTWKQPRCPSTDEWIKKCGIYTQWTIKFSSVSSVPQLCPTLCDPMNHSTPGLPVHHQLPEFTQTHVHWVCDAIQPSQPRLSLSPPAFSLVPDLRGNAFSNFSPLKIMFAVGLSYTAFIMLRSVQFSRSVVSNSLQSHESQHTRPPCPSPTPRVHSDSRPLSLWCHPAISSSVVPFSSHLQSFPASESFPVSQFFASGGHSIGISASASILPMNSQGWIP